MHNHDTEPLLFLKMPLFEHFSYTALISGLILPCCVASIAISLTALFLHVQNRSPGRGKKYSGISVCRNPEEAKFILGGSGKKENMFEILQSRAGPNGRLIRAFGINNAFTTTDTEYHKEFVDRAAALLNLNSTRWELLAEKVVVLVKGNIKRQRASSPDGTVLLPRLLQITILRAVLTILFPTCDASPLSEEDQDCIAYEVADKINRLWIESKSTDHTNPEDLESLRIACQKLLPGITMDSSLENPLNLILPAFETLWRIVFRCFIEVRFRDMENLASSTLLLRDYLATPTSEIFMREDTRGISVSHIVNESLRLYPPTKRVYRRVQGGSLAKPDVAIDIQQIHHDPEIWGPDAIKFRPSRWRKEEMKKDTIAAFFPFGMKPLICPAKKTFAPRIIGIVVASLSAALDGVEGLEIVGEEMFHSGALLENERDSYRSMGMRWK